MIPTLSGSGVPVATGGITHAGSEAGMGRIKEPRIDWAGCRATARMLRAMRTPHERRVFKELARREAAGEDLWAPMPVAQILDLDAERKRRR